MGLAQIGPTLITGAGEWAMQAGARRVRPATSLELETDPATLRGMLSMIGGTICIVTAIGVFGIFVASGSFSSYFYKKPYAVETVTSAERLAKQVELSCRVGAAAMTVSRDPVKAAAGRDLADQCEEAGETMRRSLPFWK